MVSRVFQLQDGYRGRVGFYGGTFDPIHNAHLYAASQAMAACRLDDLVFMPTALPPHKDNADRTPPHCRFHMVELAIQGHPQYSVTDVELQAARPTYTADTLEKLHTLLPRAKELIYIMGADSFQDLHKWRQPDRILALAHLAVVYRPGYGVAQLEQTAQAYRQTGAVITLIACPGLDISSSHIRAELAEGRSVEALVPPAVARYIQQRCIYTKEAKR